MRDNRIVNSIIGTCYHVKSNSQSTLPRTLPIVQFVRTFESDSDPYAMFN